MLGAGQKRNPGHISTSARLRNLEQRGDKGICVIVLPIWHVVWECVWLGDILL